MIGDRLTGGAAVSAPPILTAHNLCKSYNGVPALLSLHLGVQL